MVVRLVLEVLGLVELSPLLKLSLLTGEPCGYAAFHTAEIPGDQLVPGGGADGRAHHVADYG
jgi:hypothetical protein